MMRIHSGCVSRIHAMTVLKLMSSTGMSSECLEGAPITTGSGLSVYDPLTVGPSDCLYLGTGAVCPAAMGWIATLLGHMLGVVVPVGRVGGDGVEIWEVGGDVPAHQWQWPMIGRWEKPDPVYITEMHGPVPDTDAAKVAAVLSFEMGKVL